MIDEWMALGGFLFGHQLKEYPQTHARNYHLRRSPVQAGVFDSKYVHGSFVTWRTQECRVRTERYADNSNNYYSSNTVAYMHLHVSESQK